MMQTLAEVNEGKCSNDEVVEVLSDDEYIKWGGQEVTPRWPD